MWTFIVMIIFGIIGFAASYFAPGISAIVFYGLLFAGFFIALVSFILLILMIVEKKKWIWYLIAIILYILYLLFLPDVYHFARGHFLVSKRIKETYNLPYKILGINKKDHKFGENGYDSCSYVFDVKLEDGENIVFQSGYCEVGSMWTEYSTVDNYGNNYVPHYFEKFKKETNTTLKIETAEEEFLTLASTIHYDKSNVNELCDFLHYLDDHNAGSNYDLELVGEDENNYNIVHSWNHFDLEYHCLNGDEY